MSRPFRRRLGPYVPSAATVLAVICMLQARVPQLALRKPRLHQPTTPPAPASLYSVRITFQVRWLWAARRVKFAKPRWGDSG